MGGWGTGGGGGGGISNDKRTQQLIARQVRWTLHGTSRCIAAAFCLPRGLPTGIFVSHS